jgi:hypothetical protein
MNFSTTKKTDEKQNPGPAPILAHRSQHVKLIHFKAQNQKVHK